MIFRKSWNWPSYSRECLRYWRHWHLVVETSSSTVKKPTFASLYCRLWIWRHDGTQHWSSSRARTNYGNSHLNHSKIQNTLITSHFSQLKLSGTLWRMSWKYWGHFNNGPWGCQKGIQSHCITWSQCTMTCSTIWTAWWQLGLRRKLHGRKTCSWLWSQLDRSCPNSTQKWLRWRECFSFLHISSIGFGCCDRLESGT